MWCLNNHASPSRVTTTSGHPDPVYPYCIVNGSTAVTLSSNFLTYSVPVVKAPRLSNFAPSLSLLCAAAAEDRTLLAPYLLISDSKRSSIGNRGLTSSFRYSVQAQLPSLPSTLISSSRRLCSESLTAHNYSQFESIEMMYCRQGYHKISPMYRQMNPCSTTGLRRNEGTYSPKKGSESHTGSYSKLHWMPSLSI